MSKEMKERVYAEMSNMIAARSAEAKTFVETNECIKEVAKLFEDSGYMMLKKQFLDMAYFSYFQDPHLDACKLAMDWVKRLEAQYDTKYDWFVGKVIRWQKEKRVVIDGVPCNIPDGHHYWKLMSVISKDDLFIEFDVVIDNDAEHPTSMLFQHDELDKLMAGGRVNLHHGGYYNLVA